MEETTLPYSVETIDTKNIILKADPTVIWSLHSSDSVTPFVTPVGYSNVGTVIAASAVARHTNGKSYYLLNNQTQGYDVTDCQDETEPEIIAPEIIEEKPAGIPGALHVPRAVQRILIKTDLPTYASPGLAVKREKPTERIVRQGMQEFDELKYGMLRLVDTNYWINPADNVIKPVVVEKPKQVLDGAKEAEENYMDFKDQFGKLSEKYYTAKDGGAFVIDFKTGNTRQMPGGAHVWLAGITGVGGMGYGITTTCMELDPPRFVGIRLGDLYEDETFSKETTLEERQVLRTLKPSDHVILVKAKFQKKFMEIKGRK